MKRLAICLGLTGVDPVAYGGWDGECNGCDRDAARVATVCHDAGFDGVSVLVNQAANSRNLKALFVEASRQLVADDLLVLYFSGHGGQQPDEDGDEMDGRDETLCLWNGELVDDMIAVYLRRLKRRVRVLMATDSCNSGTNYRGLPSRRRSARRSTPVKFIERNVPGIRASLLHFGGCADGRSSFGDDEGGVFTIAWLKTLSRCRKRDWLTYGEWFDRTDRLMPGNQKLVISEWGEPSFAMREALT